MFNGHVFSALDRLVESLQKEAKKLHLPRLTAQSTDVNISIEMAVSGFISKSTAVASLLGPVASPTTGFWPGLQ